MQSLPFYVHERSQKYSLASSKQALHESFLLHIEKAMGNFLAEQAVDGIAVGLAGVALIVKDDRYALVGGFQHRLRFRDHAEQADGEDFLDVFHAEHFAAGHALGVVAGQQQVFLDRLFAFHGAPRFARQQAEHAVGVAYRGDFRVGHDNRLIGEVHGQVGAFLDTGRRGADHVFEIFAQFLDDFFHAFFGQRVFVAGLAGSQHIEVFQALVFDQRLLQRGFAVDHVDEVVHHATFAAHDQVGFPQADVEVDDDSFVPAQGEAGTDGGAGGGFTHATLAGSDYEDLGQGDSPQKCEERRESDSRMRLPDAFLCP